MKRKNIALSFAALTALTLSGAWLIGLLGDGKQAGNISGWDNLSSLVGFFMLVGGLCGLIFLIRHSLPPISLEEMVGWDIVRKQGRRSFIRRLTLRGFIIGFVSSSLILLKDPVLGKPLAEDVWAYALLVPISTFGSLYAAYRIW